MDVISMTVGLPLAPVRLVLAVARILEEEAEGQLYDPSRVRRELEEIEEAQAADQLADDEAAAQKERVVSRITHER